MEKLVKQFIERWTVYVKTDYMVQGISRTIVGSGFILGRAQSRTGVTYSTSASSRDTMLPNKASQIAYTFGHQRERHLLNSQTPNSRQTMCLPRHNAVAVLFPNGNLFGAKESTPTLLPPNEKVPAGTLVHLGAYTEEGENISLQLIPGVVVFSPDHAAGELYKVAWHHPVTTASGAPLVVLKPGTAQPWIFAIATPPLESDKRVAEFDSVPLIYLLQNLDPNGCDAAGKQR